MYDKKCQSDINQQTEILWIITSDKDDEELAPSLLKTVEEEPAHEEHAVTIVKQKKLHR